MKLRFPIKGLNTGLALEDQPPTTSPSLQNVRAFDISEERIRGGQRPGLKKAYTTQVGGEHPVLAMVTITTTYIPPE
jgi:hypothetical protein